MSTYNITIATDITYSQKDRGDYELKFYYCDTCHYCFEAYTLPDRCPDCGARIYREQPAVRLAKKNEIDELLKMRAEDKE